MDHKLSEIADRIIEYVRRNHNSRSDELMKLIADYDGERAIAESQAPQPDGKEIKVSESLATHNASIPPHPRIGYVGRIVFKDGINYTVTGHSLPDDEICVWNPATNILIRFDNADTFKNWAYGTPVPSGRL